MAKRLIVAEKPSVGKDIAKVLNCRVSHKGYIIGDNDIVTWAVGHLVELCYPDELDEKYKEWKIEDLPIFPAPFQLRVASRTESQYEIVKSLMTDAEVDRIVCATDAGREGELIFRYIYQMVGCDKPVERLWISSLTYRAIKEGFENLKPASEYDDLYESARCRSEADWLIGMNGSRAYAIENDMHGLAVGRVLSPTLAILVRRKLEQDNFVPEDYCELLASFDGFEGRLVNPDKEDKTDTDEWSRFQMDMKPELDTFVNNHSHSGNVIFCDSKEDTRPARQLFDLTSLQREANIIYRMSSKQTLDTAQKLYETRKAITYPRTDSRCLTADIKSTLTKRLEGIGLSELNPYTEQAIASEKNLFGRFINNAGVSDHHAIIPTGEAKDIDTWTVHEKQIYDLICRRFIGMFFPDRVTMKQTIKVRVDDRVFLSHGEKVIESGWGEVDNKRLDHVQTLPDLKENSQVTVKSMEVKIDQTKPPVPHTEASLLLAMEHAGKIVPEDSEDDTETEFGIGTPATRAATIEKIIEKQMAVRRGRTLTPTEYGIKLISILPEFLQSPELTGEWEAKLSRISKGKGSPDDFMAGIRDLTKEVVSFAIKQGDTGIKDANTVGLCPLCKSPVREYDKAYYCANKECGFRNIRKAQKGFHPTLFPDDMRVLLEEGKADTEKGTYTLIDTPPYIAFDRAPRPVPNYEALRDLIEDYGLSPVDKVLEGGGLWFQGEREDELLLDFISDCKEIGCLFDYSDDSKALKHKSGWYHRVDQDYKQAYANVFHAQEKDQANKSTTTESKPEPDHEAADPVIELVKKSGFEYADKRGIGGSLWIIAGADEGKELINQCRALGMKFAFSAKGGKTSKKRPAWYSLKAK